MRDTPTPKQPQDWATLITQLIERPGWSRARVAREVGVTPRTVGRWANGETVNVGSRSMRLVARALGLPVPVVARAAVGAQADRHRADDKLIAYVQHSDEHTDDEKRKIIEYIEAEREKTEDSLIAAVELMLRKGREAS